MTGYRQAVLLGDPGHFCILGGANPHTRTRWGRRKSVDRALARRQWDALSGLLKDRGVRGFVVPGHREHPGLVFPANAGFLARGEERIPRGEKVFVLSRALPSRSGEREIFRAFLGSLGFKTADFPTRFEGEADLFRAGDFYLFTSGPLARQRFAPRWGWPPYRRIYGFRSDAAAAQGLEGWVDRPLLPLTLVRETHYHGDTCLCAFGPGREFLMAYPAALSAESMSRLRERFRERLLILGEADGENFAANSFQIHGSPPALLIPHRASARLLGQIKERGVEPLPVDVSEFMEKGGGSVKCLIGDLGWLDV